MRLITRIINLNEVFSEIFSQRGHTRQFDQSHEKDDHGEHSQIQPPEIDFDIPNDAVLDLEGIISPERFQCPEPSDDSLIEHIEDIFRKSRGPELGTVSMIIDFDYDHILMVCSLAVRCWPLLSRSSPGAGRILSRPTSVMRSRSCTISLLSCSTIYVPTTNK